MYSCKSPKLRLDARFRPPLSGFDMNYLFTYHRYFFMISYPFHVGRSWQRSVRLALRRGWSRNANDIQEGNHKRPSRCRQVSESKCSSKRMTPAEILVTCLSRNLSTKPFWPFDLDIVLIWPASWELGFNRVGEKLDFSFKTFYLKSLSLEKQCLSL